EWWPIIEAELLKLSVVMIGADGNKNVAAVSHRFYPMRNVAGSDLTLTYGRGMGANGPAPLLRKAEGWFAIEDADKVVRFEGKEAAAAGAVRFHQLLRAAAARTAR